MPLLNTATAVYRGATPVQAIYKGAAKVWPASALLPRHSIWAPNPLPGTIASYNDGTPSIRLGQCFYRTGASTVGWKVVGGRVFIPNAAALPPNVTISLLTHPYTAFSTFNINAAPIRSATVPVVDGWTTATWQPYVLPTGTVENAWIVYSFSTPNHYVYASGVRPDANPVQAADGSGIHWSESAIDQHSAAYSINGGSTQPMSNDLNSYGIDIVVEEA